MMRWVSGTFFAEFAGTTFPFSGGHEDFDGFDAGAVVQPELRS
jgi:hypothetical protein